ncbi:hypothetical protein B296_00057636 [Ensete ventricosum]|uniref:Uncharacterized protein n=1 Tax=Ensete ventricosum TaxID=4639 RepID=A0A426XQG3_ENSVE|nr:hypothetical protein B296_00057636 [Ensete ventricosum]
MALKWLRTSGGVPFLLEMLTTRREGTMATGKSGRPRLAAVGGETTTARETGNDSKRQGVGRWRRGWQQVGGEEEGGRSDSRQISGYYSRLFSMHLHFLRRGRVQDMSSSNYCFLFCFGVAVFLCSLLCSSWATPVKKRRKEEDKRCVGVTVGLPFLSSRERLNSFFF